MACFLLPVSLLSSFVYLVATQPCQKTGGSVCGCPSVNKPLKKFNDQDRYILSRATHEDEEYYYIDDMAFRKTQIASDGVLSQQVGGIPDVYWSGGVIHYYIDRAFTPQYRNTILYAINTLENSVGKAHLEFVEARSVRGKICQTSYVSITKTDIENQCRAEVGMQSNKPTGMWLNEKSCTNGIIVHELLHVLGRFHEHSRPDYASFVSFEYSEMDAKFCENFDVMPEPWARIDRTLTLPYDIESIMHYGPCSFSCTGNFTILTKTGNTVAEANRHRLTELDKAKLKAVFPTSAKKKSGGPDLCIGEDDKNLAVRLRPQLPICTAAVISWPVAILLIHG